ncbi:SKP1-interacting partner 15 [Aristolochia californica]|uniref:SKP1-interacting partner 15 n=1 Tax=Aristolochia californica TaxID=171875 RepID=UPI0035DC22D6
MTGVCDLSLMERLPSDALYQIFAHLSLPQILLCRSVCKLFHQTLTAPAFLRLVHPLSLLAIRGHVSPFPALHALDPRENRWLRFSLDFLASPSASPVAASLGLLYLWIDSSESSQRSLAVCNPLTRRFRLLPPLGSAWARHGTVLVSGHRVLVLSELAVISLAGTDGPWQKFSSNLASKPRSPTVIGDSVFALCDVGSPWRSQWKLFWCRLSQLGRTHLWAPLERHDWSDVFDILKRPRLVPGVGNNILMIGGLKSSFALNSPCSTILILLLDLESLKWDEVSRMPEEMYQKFCLSGKFKVFGGGGRVWFSGKRVGRFAMWGPEGWQWVEGIRGNGDGLFRGFVFDASLTAVP